LLFAALSLAVAGGTGWLAWRVVHTYEAKLDAAATVTGARAVVVAARELRAGVALVPEDLRIEELAVTGDGGSLFAEIEPLVGQIVGDRILPGEPVRTERLLAGGAQPRINEIIDPGARAVTIRGSRAAVVGGLLQPGYYVDVIVTIRPDSDTLSADWVTETILQGVRVLAVGESVSRSPVQEEGERGKIGEPAEGPEMSEASRARESWVTLEVEPEEAEQLALAAARGQLHMSLRARDDFEMMAAGKPLVTNALLGLPPPVQAAQAKRLERKRAIVARATPRAAPTPAPAAPAPAHTTEVIRGTKSTTEQFDAEGYRITPSKGR
jgi:pilus assembly protein CpaB